MGLFDVALAWHQAGASVVPAAADGTKAPAVPWKPYEHRPADPAQLAAWFADDRYDGLGLVCGAVSDNLEMFELEGRAVELAVDLARLFADHGQAGLWTRLNRGYLEVTPTGGFHWLYRVDGPARRNMKLARRPATGDELAVNPAEKVKVLAETRGEGGYVVVAPSNGRTHPTGKSWVVVGGGITSVPTLTVEERDLLHALAGTLDQMPIPQPVPAATTNTNGSTPGDRPGDDYNTRTDWQEILGPAGWVRATRVGTGYGWRRPGKDRGISGTTGTSGDGGDRLYVFSTSTRFDDLTPYSKFAAYTLLEHGGDYPAAARALRSRGYGAQPPPAQPIDPATLIAPTRPPQAVVAVAAEPEIHRSHLRIAERLTVTHADTLRYAHGLGWHVWDGTRWTRDRDGAPTRAAIAVLKQAAAQADAELAKDIRKAETANSLSSVLAIAACLHPLTVPAEALDPDPYLLNVTNGTLDLRTGNMHDHDRNDLITRIAGCGYDPDAGGPAFEKFTAEILPDPDVLAFVQRLVGQALIGTVTEHILPIFTGTGCNGKTTLVELLMRTLGEYAISADPELLVEHGYGRHPTGQADLLGARLTVIQETDEGRKLAAATVKRLTGGDKIRARKMRQDFFEFTPSHTVLMVTNHKPRVSGDDPALWRRIHVVPFDMVISNPDTTLPDRLSLELPAVLAWLVTGYREYVREGLAPPEVVTERTKDYRVSSDKLGRFLEDRTLASPTATARARELFTAWSGWCHDTGELAGSEVEFAAALARRGFEKINSRIGRIYPGLMILSDGEGEDDS